MVGRVWAAPKPKMPTPYYLTGRKHSKLTTKVVNEQWWPRHHVDDDLAHKEKLMYSLCHLESPSPPADAAKHRHRHRSPCQTCQHDMHKFRLQTRQNICADPRCPMRAHMRQFREFRIAAVRNGRQSWLPECRQSGSRLEQLMQEWRRRQPGRQWQRLQYTPAASDQTFRDFDIHSTVRAAVDRKSTGFAS